MSRGHRFARLLSTLPAFLVLLIGGLGQVELAGADEPPAAPSELRAIPHDFTSIALRWTDNASDESGFEIQRTTDPEDPGSWSTIGTPPANETSYVDSAGLAARTRYFYRVAAVGAGGTSGWSDPWASAFAVYSGVPLSDWAVVTDYREQGFDDTKMIQAALDALDVQGLGDGYNAAEPHVLFFPNGTYVIEGTLHLEGGIGVMLVGESPGGVILQWAGPAGQDETEPAVMFHADGNPRAVFRNLVWDGGWDGDPDHQNWVVAFDQSACSRGSTNKCEGLVYNEGTPWEWPNSPDHGFWDSNSGHFDSTFRNAFIGLRVGHYHFQDSELTIRRCRFDNNLAGISIEDFNALDIWIWDSAFTNNYLYGVTNVLVSHLQREDPQHCPSDPHGLATWAGDYRVLRGRFENNYVDAALAPTGQFTFRDCWSSGAHQFLWGHGNTSTPGMVTVINSRIANLQVCSDPGTIECDSGNYSVQQRDCSRHEGKAIDVRNSGPLLLIDNAIDSSYACGAETCNFPKPVFADTCVTGGDCEQTDVLALDNRYTVTDPYDGTRNKINSWGDQLVDPFGQGFEIPEIPSFVDPLLTRPIYTVTEIESIQDVLDAAAGDAEPAIVHIPDGRYELSESLVIGPGSDLIVTGNGSMPSDLRWISPDDRPMFEIDGRRVAGLTIQDLRLDMRDIEGDGIAVRNMNQEESRVLLNQTMVLRPGDLSGSGGGAILVRDLDRVKVDAVDIHMATSVGGADGMIIQAGPQSQVGTAVWTGMTGGHVWDFDILNSISGVKALVSSTYMEHSTHYLRVRGDTSADADGEVCAHGGKMGAIIDQEDDSSVVAAESFRGNLSIIGFRIRNQLQEETSIWPKIDPADEPLLTVQTIGNQLWGVPEYRNTSASELIRVNGKLWCGNPNTDPEPLFDVCGDSFSWRSLPDGTCDSSIPACEPGFDVNRVYEAFHLLRAMEMPGFYDEPGATEPYQINLSRLLISEPSTGIILSGLAIPQNLQATPVQAGQVDLAWTDTALDESGYRVERAESPAGPWEEVATLGADAESYSDTTVEPVQDYHYRVVATRGSTGDSSVSDVVSLTTGPGQASNPSPADGATGLSRYRVTLSWTAGEGAVFHDVWLGPCGAMQQQTTTQETEFVARWLQRDTLYCWRIDERATLDGPTTTGLVWQFTTRSWWW